jgi:hypothetical protein
MIVPEIIDKLLALPAAFMRAAKMIGNPAQDSTKRKRARRSNGCGSFAMRIARHDKLPNDLERTLLAWRPRFHPISADLISGRVVCYVRQQALFSGQLCVARGAFLPMMSVEQTGHLIDWAIAGVIVVGGLFYFFGPVALRTDDVIAVGLVILALIGFRIGLRRYRE